MTTFKITPIPLEKDDMLLSIKNPDTLFYIDYSNSQFKKEQFFSYLNNLNIKSEIIFDESISYQDFDDLICTYMTTEIFKESYVLSSFVGHILLKYIGCLDSPYKLNIDDVYIDKFIENHVDIIKKWIIFIDSTIVFNERLNGIVKDYKEIDDINYIGVNVVNLFKDYVFLFNYGEIDREKEIYYFVKQGNLPMFNNLSILQYLNEEYNPIIKLNTLAITGHQY